MPSDGCRMSSPISFARHPRERSADALPESIHGRVDCADRVSDRAYARAFEAGPDQALPRSSVRRRGASRGRSAWGQRRARPRPRNLVRCELPHLDEALTATRLSRARCFVGLVRRPRNPDPRWGAQVNVNDAAKVAAFGHCAFSIVLLPAPPGGLAPARCYDRLASRLGGSLCACP
jgi:hypothetical protein